MKDQILIVFSIISIYSGLCKSHECIPRNLDFESVICVCNSTYCDTIERPPKISNDEYVLYTSSKAGQRFAMERGIFQDNLEIKSLHNTITTNSDKTFQSIIGWGGGITDAAGININSLSPSARNLLLRSYYSEDGIEYNIARIPIGGTDCSTRPYSYNDGDPDPELKNFSLAPEDHKYKIPVIKEANSISNNTLKLFASAWIAPIWMKHNGKITGLDFLKWSMYQPWANYFLKFLKAYKEQGVNFWGITTGNEPLTGLIPHEVPSVGWLPFQMSTWIANNLGPTLQNSEFASLKVIAIDCQIYNYPIYIDTMFFFNKNSRQYVDGFGLHWYRNQEHSYSSLTRTHNKYPEKFILATEASLGSKFSNGPGVSLGNWHRAELYANDIIKDLENWVTGWVDWNMALDIIGGPSFIENFLDSPIIVNASLSEFYKQPMYYALGHFSKFIPSDSQRIEISQSINNLDVIAFRRPSGENVAVLLNKKTTSVTVNWINTNGKSIQKSIAPKSITTILYH